MSITLANVDDASVITGDISYVGNEGEVVAGDLNATDVEGLTDTTYFTVTNAATNGTAVIDAETVPGPSPRPMPTGSVQIILPLPSQTTWGGLPRK